MKQYFVIGLVFGLLTEASASSSGTNLAQVEAALIQERANIEASTPFVPAALLDQLQGLDDHDLSRVLESSKADSGTVRRALREVALTEDFHHELAEKGLLLDSGCQRARVGGFEWALVHDPANQPVPLESLVRNAYGVVIARITEARGGFYMGLGTRVVAEVEEVVGATPLVLEKEDRVEYFRGEFHFTVGGVELCAERPGFEKEQPGDRVLLLTAPPGTAQEPDAVAPSLAFLLRDGNVVLQPYPFLRREQPIALGTVRGWRRAERVSK